VYHDLDILDQEARDGIRNLSRTTAE
jgi:hypothetical protein